MMFKNCIVRTPCPAMVSGITSAPELGKPDFDKALNQHKDYIKALETCGAKVKVLPANNDFPDSCFVEDVALLTSKCAIITNPGAESRNGETKGMSEVLKQFYDQVECITVPGTIEGGDVMMVGNHFYIGISARTNLAGAEQCIQILEKYGHTGSVVHMKEYLHLKTGLAYLEDNVLLIGGEFLENPIFDSFDKIVIPEDEDYAANCIRVNDYVLVPAGFEKTRQAIEQKGLKTLVVDTSEFRKLDGGLSCLSLRF